MNIDNKKKIILLTLGATYLYLNNKKQNQEAKSLIHSKVAPQVGVILPDSSSLARWKSIDRPAFLAAFKTAGISVDIQNANGDASKFVDIANQMIKKGIKVLIMTGLNSETTYQIQLKAKKSGIKTIDYDRLTLGGSADYYVSIDNTAVGRLQGEGIINWLQRKNVKNPRVIYLNGSPIDSNTTLFKQGYDSVIRPYLKANNGTIVDDQSVPDWDNVKARMIFEQQFAKAGGKIDAVVAANEGLGLAVVEVLKKNNLNGKVAVCGQDASADGLAAILTDDLSNTVYKSIKSMVNATVSLTSYILKGIKPKINVYTNNGRINVPSVLVTPVSITAVSTKISRNNTTYNTSTVGQVVKDGFVKATDIYTSLLKSGLSSTNATILLKKYNIKL